MKNLENEDFITHGLGRLASQYRGGPKIVGLLTGILDAAQKVEDLFFSMIQLLNYASQTGAPLRLSGSVIGAVDTLPNGEVLTVDSDYRDFLELKIRRNSAKNGSWYEVYDQLKLIFDPDDTGLEMSLTNLGSMYAWFTVWKTPTARERGIMALGDGIIPITSTVELIRQYIPTTGCFCFSTVSAPGVPLVTGGQGFNTTTNSTNGSWSGVF